MRSNVLIWVVGGCLLSAAATPSIALPGPRGPSDRLSAVMEATAANPAPPNYYTGPDGAYDPLSDLVRDIEGTPCGMTCTRAKQDRWQRSLPQPHRIDRE